VSDIGEKRFYTKFADRESGFHLLSAEERLTSSLQAINNGLEMRILAVDTSTDVCSVCIMVDGSVVAEYSTRSSRTHTERLMPAIEQLLSDAELGAHDLNLLAVVHGPGSFTGLRIGLSAIKGLSFALHCPVVEASALDMAARQIADNGFICPAMDARRGEIFAALYRRTQGRLERLTDPVSVVPEVWREKLPDAPVFFCGAGAALYAESLKKHPESRIVFRDFHLAQTLAQYAREQSDAGKTISGDHVRAAYLRPSDAETHGPRPSRKPDRIPD
jgi:tRNA threonylcarbamoyladenosine biosynthesis protein TsaB